MVTFSSHTKDRIGSLARLLSLVMWNSLHGLLVSARCSVYVINIFGGQEQTNTHMGGALLQTSRPGLESESHLYLGDLSPTQPYGPGVITAQTKEKPHTQRPLTEILNIV